MLNSILIFIFSHSKRETRKILLREHFTAKMSKEEGGTTNE